MLTIPDNSWVQPYLNQIGTRIGAAITLSAEQGAVISPEATDGEISNGIHHLMSIRQKNNRIACMVDRFVGQLILHYAAVHDVDWTTAISQLDLANKTGKHYRSLMKLPRIVCELPDEAFNMPGVNTQHLDAATSFAPPKDPDERSKFNARRMDILRKVAEDPLEFTKSFVVTSMRELQQEFGILPSRRPGLDQIKMNMIHSFLILLEFKPEDYEKFGITKQETLERLDKYRQEAIDRDVIPENLTDPLEFCPPWKVVYRNKRHDDDRTTIDVPAGEADVGEATGRTETELQGQGAPGIQDGEGGTGDGGEAHQDAPVRAEPEQVAAPEGDRVFGEQALNEP